MTPLRMRWIPTRPGRRRESAIAWPLVLLAALACRPRPASEPPPTTEAPPAVVEAPPAPRSDPELVAIADAIDPGEVAPMIEGMPERLRSSLERMYPAYTPVEELEALARDDLAAYLNFRGGPPEVETLALLRLGRAVYLGERLLLAGRDDAELLALLQTAYTYLDRPYFTREAGFFRGSFPSIVERAAKAG
ncbi:MAG: hypothetical protein R3B09_35530, partial [Nannocystaceae bacterium]